MCAAVLMPSAREGKKWVIFINNKLIHFGADGYSDFTKHRDQERKLRYLARHGPREDWQNPYTAGFWSRWLLWNKPTLEDSIEDVYKRFGISVKFLG